MMQVQAPCLMRPLEFPRYLESGILSLSGGIHGPIESFPRPKVTSALTRFLRNGSRKVVKYDIILFNII